VATSSSRQLTVGLLVTVASFRCLQARRLVVLLAVSHWPVATLRAAPLALSPSPLALVRVVLAGLLRLLLALRPATLPAVALFLLPAAAPRLAAMSPSLLARVFRPVVR
jgi:hypothetical protein